MEWPRQWMHLHFFGQGRPPKHYPVWTCEDQAGKSKCRTGVPVKRAEVKCTRPPSRPRKRFGVKNPRWRERALFRDAQKTSTFVITLYCMNNQETIYIENSHLNESIRLFNIMNEMLKITRLICISLETNWLEWTILSLCGFFQVNENTVKKVTSFG
jgi:hypothetical protein